MHAISDPAPVHEATAASPRYSSAQGWFVVGALSIASIVSYIDRQVINLLVDPIKAGLGLTDVHISLLQGFSFALFYAILAVPIAWVADRYNRKLVILLGLLCWSLATFGSGLATGFAMLFAARMVIGVGEATLSPAGMSMISDYFAKPRLPGPISVFVGSGFIGSGLALLVGGYLYAALERAGPTELPFGTFEPWQLTFFAVALLSIPVFVLLLAMREPIRSGGRETTLAGDMPPKFEVLGFLKARASLFVPLIVGFSCFAAAQFGIGAWAPSYFIRVHGWSPLEVGQFFGPAVMLSGLAGVVFGGFAAEAMLARGIRDATLRLPMLAIACALPFAIAFPMMESAMAALALLTIVLFLGTIPFGAGVATFPLVTPNRMRAQVIAVYLLVANLLGYSAGPILVAWLTDNVFADPLAIDRSLSIAPPLTMAAGLLLVLLALKPLRSAAATISIGDD